jgi:DNA (cytosine-5)-methyltransferase 1
MTTIGSLCSGVGGLDLGVMRFFDADLIWVSEDDPAASAVLAHHFPDACNHGDLRDAKPELLDAVDILTCGFPCGPVAPIGKQKGTADPRWLCPDIVEFVDAMPLPPTTVIFENVVGLLSNNGGATVREFLGSIAELGYALRWAVVQAGDAQAPHRRSRWFCLATHADSSQLQRRRVPHQLERPSAPQHRPGLAAVLAAPVHSPAPPDRDHDFDFQQFEPRIRRWELTTGWPAPSPLIDSHLNSLFSEWAMGLPPGWVTDLIPARDDRFRLIGNAVVPQQAALALHCLTS